MSDTNVTVAVPDFRHEQPLKTSSGWRVDTFVDQHCSRCGKEWTALILQRFTTKGPPTETTVTKDAARECEFRVYCCPECRGFADSAMAIHFSKGFLAAADDAIQKGPGRKLLYAGLGGCTSIFAFVVSVIGLSSTGSAVLLGFVGILIAIGLLLFAFYSCFQALLAKMRYPKLKARLAGLSEKEAEDVFNRAKDTAWTTRLHRSSAPKDSWLLADALLDEAEKELKKLLVT